MPRLMRLSGQRWAKSVLAAFLILAVGAGAQSGPALYTVIRLANGPTYSSAYGQVNKQLTALQLRRTGSTRRAKCRNESAIKWLAEQANETASWQVAPSERQRNDALAAELKSELAAQSKLQACKGLRARRKT
jgi:hypothetical protein